MNLVLRIYGNCLIRDSIRYILNNDIINTLDILIWIVTLKHAEGSYETDDINNTIQHEMEKRGHHDPINEDYYINISANSNTLILEKDYQVHFNHQNSLSKVLAFTGAKYTEGFH